MGRYREKASKLLTTLTYGLGTKQRPATISSSISESPGSPAPQTGLIFKLPEELILFILSHLAPDTKYTDHWVRFRLLHECGVDDPHQQRVWALRPLSMTCKAMRLRLVPRIWECLEFHSTYYQRSGDILARKLRIITKVLRVDIILATSVKSMTVDLAWNMFSFSLFVKCLESLPNLHTLEIGRVGGSDTTALKLALWGVKLPHIRTLILPPTAHPLLEHCPDVEDIVCVARDEKVSPDKLLGSLPSEQDSKVKRLAIPLVTCVNPRRFVAACPRLTELTVIFPHQQIDRYRTFILPNHGGRARSAISDLADACKALPDFDTLQIARFPLIPPPVTSTCNCVWWPDCGCGYFPMGGFEEPLEKEMRDLEECAIDCLKKPRMGCLEVEGRRTTLRVIKFDSYSPSRGFVEVAEYEA